MGKWVKDRLDSLGDIVAGGTPSTNVDAYWDGEIPFVTPYDLSKCAGVWIDKTARYITKAGLKNSAANLLPPQSIVISTRAPIGYIALTLEPSVSNQGCKSVVLKEDQDKVFHCYNLSAYVGEMKRLGVGTTFSEISKADLSRIKVCHPVSLDEQRHIAEILTTCDEVIEKSEAVAEKYRAIKSGMLKDLFTRGIGRNGKLRPTPESAPQLYKDTALGKVPREWEVKSFDSAFELHGNNTLSRAFLTNQNGVVRNVHYGDVLVKYDTILDCDDEALPSVIAEGLRQAGNDYLQNGDLVFADTAEDDTVGKAVELYNVGDRTIVSGLHTIFARPKEDDFASRWLGYYVNSDSFHKQLLPFVVGSKVSSISRTNIKRTFVVIPESDEQQRIAERLSAIDVKIADELAVIAKYRKVKTGLMARLLTPPDGEVE